MTLLHLDHLATSVGMDAKWVCLFGNLAKGQDPIESPYDMHKGRQLTQMEKKTAHAERKHTRVERESAHVGRCGMPMV